DVALREMRRDCLVRGKHELLDDLVALVVRGEVRAHDLPLLAQVDLDLRHVELEGSAREPTLPQEHRQLEHPAQERDDLLGDAFVRDHRAYHHGVRPEEHTSELQSRGQLVCRLLLETRTTPTDWPPSKRA